MIVLAMQPCNIYFEKRYLHWNCIINALFAVAHKRSEYERKSLFKLLGLHIRKIAKSSTRPYTRILLYFFLMIHPGLRNTAQSAPKVVMPLHKTLLKENITFCPLFLKVSWRYLSWKIPDLTFSGDFLYITRRKKKNFRITAIHRNIKVKL